MEAKVWRKAALTERLVGDANIPMKKKTLKMAASITIATWLEEIHALQQRIQHGKTTSIVMDMTDTETLREADEQLKRKIYTVRGLTLRADRHGVGERAVDTSTEEPPD